MKIKFYITILLTVVFFTASAQIQTFKGEQYILNGSNYEMLNISDLQYYPINKNSITIKFKTSTSTSQIKSFEKKNNLIRLRKAKTGWHDYQTPNTKNPIEKANFFLKNSLIEDVEIPKFGKYTEVTNDDFVNNQWYLNPNGVGTIDVVGAWDFTTGNPNVVVAVLDSGIDWSHSDLGLGSDGYQNIYLNPNEDAWDDPNNPSTGDGQDGEDDNDYIDDWKGWNFANGNNNTYGSNFHGTHVAGIIGAKSNNNEGIAGIAGGWNSEGSKLLLCALGNDLVSEGVLDDAILYAAQMGAKVIQLSLGIPQTSDIDDAIEMAYNDGVTIICASGNAGASSIAYPARHPYVISVGATNETGNRASISNHGSNLFISAPGTDIFSLGNNNQYGSSSGTSFAAPIVSGIVALMYSVNPCLTNQQIEDILKLTADEVGGYNYNWDSTNPGHSLELGYGKVNPYEAVLMAYNMSSPTLLDLYVKDSPDDDGTEPNTVTQHMWTSQDIWVRNNNDGGLTHQNPEYRTNGSPNYINVRVINKSCVTSTGYETLTVNWAKANTALAWPQNWNGDLQNSGNFDLGGELNSVTIPSLHEGEEAIVVIPWEVPNPDHYSDNDNPWHFCLMARIDSYDDPMGTYTSNPNIMVRNNNNQAWKNITVVDLVADRSSASVMVANPSNKPRTFFLELQKQDNEGGKAIFEEAEVTLKMDDVLLDAWERGGKIAKKIKGNNMILNDIAFKANEMGLLTLDFNSLTKELTDKSEYTYHLVQKDANTGEVIGGETYVIRKDTKPAFIAQADGNKEADFDETITIESLSPNPVSNNLTVNYKINDASSSYLMIISYYGDNNKSSKYILDNKLQQTQINVSSYPVGYYTIALVCNDEIVDAKIFIKQ